MTRFVGALLAQAAGDDTGLNLGGTLMLALSVLLVCGLLVFCVVRIMREKVPAEHLHARLDIDPHDTD